MSNVITYDIWILTFVCLCTDNFLLHLVCLWKLYYLQLFTIIAYHLNANIMLFSYVICHYIWHMGSLYYELQSFFVERLNLRCKYPTTNFRLIQLSKLIDKETILLVKNFHLPFCNQSQTRQRKWKFKQQFHCYFKEKLTLINMQDQIRYFNFLYSWLNIT